MAASTCASCSALLHSRFRSRLSLLASLRSRSQVRTKTGKARPIPEIAYHWDTVPPTPAQLELAKKFFEAHPPRRLWTATEWRRQEQPATSLNDELGTQLVPEVVFLGRSNVGKSSLLNALFKDPDLNRVGKHPGKTTTMHAWGLSASDPVSGGAGPGGEMDVRLAVIDMPGYGFASHYEWGDEIVTYLQQRKQLRRAFVLIDGLHGVKKADETMVKLLRSKGISHQFIVSKADRLLATSRSSGHVRLKSFLEYLREMIVQPKWYKGVGGLGEVLAVGGLGERRRQKDKEIGMLGIQQVRWAVLAATGLTEGAIKKPTAIISDQKKRVKNAPAEVAETEVAREANTSTPLKRYRSVFQDVDPPIYTPQRMAVEEKMHKIHERRPFVTPLNLPDGLGDRKSTPPPSFLTQQHKQPPQSMPTSSPSSPPNSSTSHNPVGGLAELEALSSPTARKRSTSSRTKMLDPSKQKETRRGMPGAGTGRHPDRQVHPPSMKENEDAAAIERRAKAKLTGERISHISGGNKFKWHGIGQNMATTSPPPSPSKATTTKKNEKKPKEKAYWEGRGKVAPRKKRKM